MTKNNKKENNFYKKIKFKKKLKKNNFYKKIKFKK